MDSAILNDSQEEKFFSFEYSKEQESSNSEYLDVRANLSNIFIEGKLLAQEFVKQAEIPNPCHAIDTQINCHPESVNEKENDQKLKNQKKQECSIDKLKSSQLCVRGPDCWYFARNRCDYYHPPQNQKNGPSKTEENELCRRGSECWFLIRKCCRYYHPPCHYQALHERQKIRKELITTQSESSVNQQAVEQNLRYFVISHRAEGQDHEPIPIHSPLVALKNQQQTDEESAGNKKSQTFLDDLPSFSAFASGTFIDQSSKQSYIELLRQLRSEADEEESFQKNWVQIIPQESYEESFGKLAQESPELVYQKIQYQYEENIAKLAEESHKEKSAKHSFEKKYSKWNAQSLKESFSKEIPRVSGAYQSYRKIYIPKSSYPAYQRAEQSVSIYDKSKQQKQQQKPSQYGNASIYDKSKQQKQQQKPSQHGNASIYDKSKQQKQQQKPCKYGTRCHHLKRKECKYFHPPAHFQQQKNSKLPLFHYIVRKHKAQISEIYEKERRQSGDDSMSECWVGQWILSQMSDDSGDSQISLRTDKNHPKTFYRRY